MSITVNRSDIQLEEEALYRQEGLFDDAASIPLPTSWSARLFGHLSTGEHVDLLRTGETWQEARAALMQAITENGWEIK